MGVSISAGGLDKVFSILGKEYDIYAPKKFVGKGRFSDTDCIRYDKIHSVGEIVFDEKSSYSFKEILTPICQTLFYFNEEDMKVADGPKKGALVFLRSCDLHAVRRLDDMYLHNGPEDFYYKRIRDKIKFILMGCEKSFDSCFCVSMGSNRADNYDASIDLIDGSYLMDCKWKELEALLKEQTQIECQVKPSYVKENKILVSIPENLSNEVMKSSIWREYDSRCIACGRCNFVCPTCTCFSMQDIFYTDNGKSGERRRVMASCMVDGYTDVAGGGQYRMKNGDRMRFKVLHKSLNFKERKGYNMCVGCGRCDDICPEYISYSACLNKLETGMEEVTKND